MLVVEEKVRDRIIGDEEDRGNRRPLRKWPRRHPLTRRRPRTPPRGSVHYARCGRESSGPYHWRRRRSRKSAPIEEVAPPSSFNATPASNATSRKRPLCSLWKRKFGTVSLATKKIAEIGAH